MRELQGVHALLAASGHEFGFGGGVRLGALGLDVGFWTHTNSLSNERGVTMATSFSIY